MNWSWWYLVLLVPLAMFIPIIMASFKRPSITSINWGWVWTIAIVAVGWYFYQPFLNWWNKPTPQKVVYYPAPHAKVGKEKRLYRFSEYPDGCVSLNFNSEFSTYPKGGKIVIHTPNGKMNYDEPGTTHNWEPGPPGTYKICKVDAWGVEIWN